MKARTDYKELFKEIDELIRQGSGKAAGKKLASVRTVGLTAGERASYANLARRLSHPRLSVRLLHPVIRPKVASEKGKATDAEKAEYAAALVYLDAFSEALEILETIPTADHPSVLLFQSFAHIGQWNYRAAIEDLKKYVVHPKITHYQRLVGEANLCEALVYERESNAEVTLEKTIQEAHAHGYTIVHGHLQMTRIDLLVSKGKLDEAERFLATALTAFEKADTREAFFARKWKAILALYRHGLTTQVSQDLDVIRKEARERWLHWETVRDCDFYEAICTKDLEKFLALYEGTPFESFRNRLLHYCPELKTRIDQPFSWTIPKGAKPTMTLELLSGDSEWRRKLIETGKLNYRLLSILMSDFYRPFRLTTLSAHLYPGEYYNPHSSSKRVKTTIQRLREWFLSVGLPLRIEEVKGDYRLTAVKPIVLIIPQATSAAVSEARVELDLMRELLGKRETFTVKDVIEGLSVSARTANRLIKEGMEKGFLEKKGKGPKTSYAWTSPTKLAA